MCTLSAVRNGLSLLLLAGCASASSPTAPMATCPSSPAPKEDRDPAAMTAASIETAGKSDGFTTAQQEALKAAVRSCWEKARSPDAAGVMIVELLRVEPDGSVRLGGPNWAYARIFKERFFGAEDSNGESGLRECTLAWVETQKYPGVRELRASFRLLPH